MKKLLFIAITLFIVGCSGDDDNQNCTCTGQWGDADGMDFTWETPINCSTGEPIMDHPPATNWYGCQD